MEPHITDHQEEAFLDGNEVSVVLLRSPGRVFIDNECLFLKNSNLLNQPDKDSLISLT